MAKFEVSVKVGASAEDAWARVGAFGALVHANADLKTKGEGKGAVRRIPTPSGDVVERCVKAGDTFYEYVIDASPAAISGFHARFEVIPKGEDACTLKWSGTLEAPEGVDPEDFVLAFEHSLSGMLEMMGEAAAG